ncbi:MAG: hypothetical protein K0R09_2198 [Clostridiales bacterium]|jgi:hypothetical protein|nr:hypothetical protein [Clostridiales bacterium]
MKINRNTINDYIEGRPINEWSNQWIFHSIVDNQYLTEEVSGDKKDIIQSAADLIERELLNFQPYNKDIWDIIFPDWKNLIADSTVYLVVGCPNPYDAMSRISPDGEDVTIFDINRMLKYADSVEKLLPIIKNLLTHEYSHICLHTDYPIPEEKTSFILKLQYICFDEGFAHLLSFKENVKALDWMDKDMIEKKEKAYRMLIDAVKSNGSEHTELLEKAESGAFWNKFGAISGLFAIADLLSQSKYDYNEIVNVYKDGPKKLLSNIFSTFD